MNLSITLKADRSCDLVLPLNRQFVAYNGLNAVDIVYQDAKYEYLLHGDEPLKPIQNVELRIGNKPISTEFTIIEDDVYTIRINAKSERDLTPFLLLYGLTEITVCLMYSDGTEAYLFSNHLAIAIQYQHKETMDSIRDMLDDIYKKDHSLLYKMKPQNKMTHPRFHRNQDNKFEDEISTLRTIINVLKKNLPYFMKSPRTTTVSEFHVDCLEKLHTISSKNLNYIATHPEQLRQSFGASGIFVNRRQMIPQKTLVSTQRFSCDTAENRAILSFINTLLHHINARKNEIAKAISESASAIRLNGSLQDQYILTTVIIQQYAQITLNGYLTTIESLARQCANILLQYKNALPCTFSALHNIPAPTPIFLEVYHYRNIYEMITLWFSFSDFLIPSENIILHFSSADTIYEYFCLLNLYDIIVSLGYSEIIEKRTSYKYLLNDPRYIQVDEENTYYFRNGENEVTLFYQPIIYSESSATTNGITLFRTDGNFYSPDFIIRKHTPNGISYGIIDAKWRTQAVLKDRENSGSLADLVYKYLYSVADSNTLKSVPFFWLLQGKDDKFYKPTYFHNCGSTSRTKDMQFQNATGIVRLTPKSGVLELTRVLKTFIS